MAVLLAGIPDKYNLIDVNFDARGRVRWAYKVQRYYQYDLVDWAWMKLRGKKQFGE